MYTLSGEIFLIVSGLHLMGVLSSRLCQCGAGTVTHLQRGKKLKGG